LPDVSCLECGFKLDPTNESQVVCPACGADPNGPLTDPELDLAIAESEALLDSLTEGPVLVAGNTLINWIFWGDRSPNGASEELLRAQPKTP